MRAPRLHWESHRKRLRQQKPQIKKKVAVTLETRQRTEDPSSHKISASTATERFESLQHKIFSKPTTTKMPVLVIFPVTIIIWIHLALSLIKKFNNLHKLSKTSIYTPSLLNMWVPNSSVTRVSDCVFNNIFKCHFMVQSLTDSIYYVPLYHCTSPGSKIKYLATPNAAPYFS